jgi:putative membrane protein
MRNWIARWIINALALGIVAHLNVGVTYDGLGNLFIAALAIGFANSWVLPILKFFTMPLSCMTFGLFSYVLSFILFFLVGKVLDGFDVTPAGAVIGSILLSVVSGALTNLLVERRH